MRALYCVIRSRCQCQQQMENSHLHSGAAYRTVREADGSFGIEETIPGTYARKEHPGHREAEMRRDRLVAIGACGVLLSCTTARAASFLTGNELYRLCQSAERDGLCTGYIMGVVDYLNADRESLKKVGCVRAGVASDRVRDVVVKYLSDNPQARDLPAWGAVVHAVTQAWSCE